jgi:hypothetical protein
MSGSPTINRENRSTSRRSGKEGENIPERTGKDPERKREESISIA